MNGFGAVPQYYLNAGLDHFSSSQDNKAIDVWWWLYVLKDQEYRRRKKPNPNMIGGNAVQGDRERSYVNQDDQTITIEPFGVGAYIFHGYTEKKAIDSALQYLDDRQHLYDGAELDHFFIVKERTPLCIQHLIQALKQIKLPDVNKITTETYCEYQHPDIEITTIGRTDLIFTEWKRVLEIKTKWFAPDKKGEKDKHGKIKVKNRYLPSTPEFSHVLQTAFYWKATGLEPYIIYASGKPLTKKDEVGFKIFTAQNCQDLQPENLNRMLAFQRRTQLQRQNILKLQSDLGLNLEQCTKYVPSDFSNFMWRDYSSEELREIEKLWE